ncbi:MAG: redoxin family protein [Abditibacteriaceae bacterium]
MNKQLIPKISRTLMCIAPILVITFSAQAATTSINPKAQQILTHSLKIYQSLRSYQDTSVIVSNSPAGKNTTRQLISFKSPRYLNIVSINGKQRLVSNYDGKHYNYTDVDKNGLFWSNEPLPDTSYGRQVLFQYQPTGMLFTPFLAGVNPFAEPFGILMSSVKLGTPSTLGGVKVDAIIATPKDDSKTHFTYTIGQKDHLIRRISLQSLTVMGDKYTTVETHSNIRINPTFAPGTFTFHVPSKAPLKHPMEDVMGTTLKAGDTPPAINTKDIKGSVASLGQHKGKVLLVDFWASWCGPCVRSMPYLKSLYQKYHTQGFDIIGISGDAKLTDLNKFIHKESITWQQVFDNEGKAAEPYNVQYIPFSVLIGRNGKVIAVNQDSLLLDSAIRHALKR